jgi:hypothetical protein
MTDPASHTVAQATDARRHDPLRRSRIEIPRPPEQDPPEPGTVPHCGGLGQQARAELPAVTPVRVLVIVQDPDEPVHQVRPGRMPPPVTAGQATVRSGPPECESGAALFRLAHEVRQDLIRILTQPAQAVPPRRRVMILAKSRRWPARAPRCGHCAVTASSRAWSSGLSRPRGSPAKRSWQASASYRSPAASRPRAPDRDRPGTPPRLDHPQQQITELAEESEIGPPG